MLRKAFELAGGDCPFAIAYEGEVVLAEGTDGLDCFSEDDANVLCESIRFNDLHLGQVRMCIPADFSDSDRDAHKRLLQFTAYSIQEFIDAESARRSIADEALAKYRELALLHRSVPSINTSLRMRDVVASLINECRRENYPGELGMVFLSEPGTRTFRLAVQFGMPWGSNPQALADSRLFREVAVEGKGEIINELELDGRWDNELEGLGSMALIPIVSPNRTEGMLVIASENTGLFEAAHRKSLTTLASVAGISVSNAFNFEGIQTLMNAILQALAEAIDSRDPFTAGHSERVAHLAVAVAYLLSEDSDLEHIGFNDTELREIFYAGILHDVGKIGIKEDVLTKKTRLPKRHMDVLRARFQLVGQIVDFDWVEAFDFVRHANKTMTPEKEALDFIRGLGDIYWQADGERNPLLYEDELEVLLLEYGNLTHEERREIQRHPAESERILQHIPMRDGYENLLPIIRQHHERMDGSGYPDGLKGNDILLQSRLMAIVDIYDAVTQERHYKPACTRSEAVKILHMEMESNRLDAELVNFFIENIEKVENLSERVKTARVSHLSEIGNLTGL
jgi:HD-GYP domain-containing protein (c-di-GMP phosphodiesterase class II)